jgi:predicted DNA-binding protein (MmcQ/YjbR family)
MVTIENLRTIVLSFPEAVEQPHFEKASFRVRTKIFLTLAVKEKRAVVKLTPVDQSVFCDYDKSAFYPAPGAWGKQGWTRIELKKVRKDMLRDAITLSYKLVAPKSILKNFPIG